MNNPNPVQQIDRSRLGIGGDCVPRDIHYLYGHRGGYLLEGKMKVAPEYRKHMKRLLKQ